MVSKLVLVPIVTQNSVRTLIRKASQELSFEELFLNSFSKGAGFSCPRTLWNVLMLYKGLNPCVLPLWSILPHDHPEWKCHGGEEECSRFNIWVLLLHYGYHSFSHYVITKLFNTQLMPGIFSLFSHITWNSQCSDNDDNNDQNHNHNLIPNPTVE